MIHTMTIMAPIYPDADAILPILHIMNLPEDLLASEFSPDFNPNDISPKSRRFYKTNSPGINMIKLTRIAVKEAFINAAAYTRRTGFPVPQDTKFKKNEKTYLPAKYAFFLSIELNPYRLIHPEDNHSINLFIPTSDNVNALKKFFTYAMDNLFPSTYLHWYIKDLCYYNLKRIDFSFNLKFKTEDERALFQKLVHKTSSPVLTSNKNNKLQKNVVTIRQNTMNQLARKIRATRLYATTRVKTSGTKPTYHLMKNALSYPSHMVFSVLKYRLKMTE